MTIRVTAIEPLPRKHRLWCPRSVWTSRRTHLASGAVLLGILSLSAGCSVLPPPSSEIHGPVVVVTRQGSEDSNASGLVGPLTLKDGCLGIGGSPVVWPKGTTWDASTQQVVLRSGARLGVGDQLLAAGDPVDDLTASLGRDGAKAVQACGGGNTAPTASPNAHSVYAGAGLAT